MRPEELQEVLAPMPERKVFDALVGPRHGQAPAAKPRCEGKA